MEYFIYVFASRNESTAFGEYLRSRGVNSTLISTPRECMTGCGLSVKVPYHLYEMTNICFKNFPYKYTFKGVFALKKVGIASEVKRVK